MSVVNLIACFLQRRVFSLVEMLVVLVLIVAMLASQVQNLLGSLHICKLEYWRTVEFENMSIRSAVPI
jgi:hypothetical protein